MKTILIDRLNIFLLLLSLTLAFIIPFKLFLFSYAVLGPLHYLTEINWLKQKNFFVKDQKWILVFVILTLIISIPSLLYVPIFSGINELPFIKNLNISITGSTDVILLTLLFFAIGLVYLTKWQHILLFLTISLIAAKLITKYILFSYVIVGIFLPTIIHVYFFTLLFMILGTLNSKNTEGVIGIVILVLAPAIIFMSNVDPNFYLNAESTSAISTAKNFRFIQFLTEKFENANVTDQVLLSLVGVKVQIFTAFCYTYHYLNWFSKTSVIGWHKNVSKPKFILILFVWTAIVALFWYNYETAYLALFFLAILHIILEFPLNILSIKDIAAKLNPSRNR
jgi:hypothetical protein